MEPELFPFEIHKRSCSYEKEIIGFVGIRPLFLKRVPVLIPKSDVDTYSGVVFYGL